MQLRSLPLCQKQGRVFISQHTDLPVKSRLRVTRGGPALVRVMNEVATWAVRAETDSVECAARLGLILRVAGQVSQFVIAVSELTLLSILARTVFLERSAELGFVAGRVDLRAGFLLKEFLKLLTAFSRLTERAVTRFVFLYQHSSKQHLVCCT